MIWGILGALIAFTSSKLGEAGFGMYAGMFLGAFALGIYSNLFARLTRGPAKYALLIVAGICLIAALWPEKADIQEQLVDAEYDEAPPLPRFRSRAA